MHKLKRLLASIALVLSLGVVGVAATASPASAYLTQCAYGQINSGKGYEICHSHVNNGGLNQVQVILYCQDPIFGTTTSVVGPWVNQGYSSAATCPAYAQNIYAHDYRLR